MPKICPIVNLNGVNLPLIDQAVVIAFIRALKGDNPYEAEDIWDGNPALSHWFQGHQVAYVGSRGVTPYIILNRFALQLFEFAVAGSHTVIVKLWDKHPILRQWYAGLPVNRGDEMAQAIRVITFEELQATLEVVGRHISDSAAQAERVNLMDQQQQVYFLVTSFHTNVARFIIAMKLIHDIDVLDAVLDWIEAKLAVVERDERIVEKYEALIKHRDDLWAKEEMLHLAALQNPDVNMQAVPPDALLSPPSAVLRTMSDSETGLGLRDLIVSPSSFFYSPELSTDNVDDELLPFDELDCELRQEWGLGSGL